MLAKLKPVAKSLAIGVAAVVVYKLIQKGAELWLPSVRRFLPG